VTGQNFDPEGIANLPEVLVPAPKNGEFLCMSVETDCDFWHALSLADPRERELPTCLARLKSSRPHQTGSLDIITQSNSEKNNNVQSQSSQRLSVTQKSLIADCKP
jgi:hypothetical protein